MSTVHYQPSRSAIDSEQYVRGEADGRGVAVTSDAPGVSGAFAARAHALAEKHNREVEVLHYRQSYGPDFDPDNPEHVQRSNDLGYLLAKKMHPHSDCLVVTHTDGKGRKVHNHILVINHDNATGRALSQYRTFHDRPELGGQRGVQRINDELMKEHGLPVARVKGLSPRDWELRREEFAEGGLDREAGDRMMAGLMDPRCTDKQALVSIIDEQNDAIREWNASHPDEQEPTMRLHSTTSKRSGKEAWTLYIEDLRGEGKRKEHRARTSTYSKGFTPTGAQEFFEFHQQHQQKETDHARTGQVEAGALDIVGVDVEARCRRAAAVDVGEDGQRPDDVHEDQRRGDDEAAPGIDLATARAALDDETKSRLSEIEKTLAGIAQTVIDTAKLEQHAVKVLDTRLVKAVDPSVTRIELTLSGFEQRVAAVGAGHVSQAAQEVEAVIAKAADVVAAVKAAEQRVTLLESKVTWTAAGRLGLALLPLAAVILVIGGLIGGVAYAAGFGPLLGWAWSSFTEAQSWKAKTLIALGTLGGLAGVGAFVWWLAKRLGEDFRHW